MEAPMTLEEKLRTLPLSPGVYLMKDSRGQIIYVGKSKLLRNRVSSYFHHTKSHSPKTLKLVQHIRDLEWIVTDTEFEAFMLECKLIKEYKPMYNRKMKTPQAYTYIAVELLEGLRSIAVADSPEKPDKHRYFGPYPSRSTVERALNSIKEHHRILCSNPASSRGACLNHSIGLCMGMCMGGEALERYERIMEQIVAFLDGTDPGLLEEMRESMVRAAEALEFEKAAKLRDAVGAVAFLQQKEQVIQFTGGNRRLAILEELEDGMVKLFLIQRNRILHRHNYDAGRLTPAKLQAQVSSAIRKGFRRGAAGQAFPQAVTRDEIDEAQIIYSYLSGGSCRYILVEEAWLEAKNHPELTAALGSFLEGLSSGNESLGGDVKSRRLVKK